MEIRSLYNNKNISLGLTTQEIEELLVNKELSSKLAHKRYDSIIADSDSGENWMTAKDAEKEFRYRNNFEKLLEKHNLVIAKSKQWFE